VQNLLLDNFWGGFIIGVVATTVILSIFNWIYSGIFKGYINRMQAADKPQTVIQKTEKTPRQVVEDADRAKRVYWILLGFSYLVLVVLLEILRPGKLGDILSLFGLQN
jgi:magnesium-transporting ATPase (P-type)